jgi:pimeloyl-ACP methyl ester carboxylesterase
MGNKPRRRPSERRPLRTRRLILPAVLTGIAVAVAIYERRVLSTLEGTADPEVNDDFAFPAQHVHAVAMADGGHLHVEECGSGPPVVLLHGHGANLRVFAPLATRLATGGRHVVAVDHRGFGLSSAVPASFGFHGLVDDLATLLEVLDLRDAVVVGHSMGGAVALGLAVERADLVAQRVAAVVLINSSARGPADRPLPRAKAAALDWSLTERVGRHGRHGLVLTRANFGVDARRRDVEAARAIGLASPAARRQGLTRRLLGIDLSDRLGEVRVPVLVLAGGNDRVVPASESQRIADALPDARLEVFSGAGHMVPMERTAQVAEMILQLATDSGRPRASSASPGDA